MAIKDLVYPYSIIEPFFALGISNDKRVPIITGIGHQRDESVLDIVAHTRAKTPTAAAELLIHAMLEQGCTLGINGRYILHQLGNVKPLQGGGIRFQLLQIVVGLGILLEGVVHHAEYSIFQEKIPI